MAAQTIYSHDYSHDLLIVTEFWLTWLNYPRSTICVSDFVDWSASCDGCNNHSDSLHIMREASLCAGNETNEHVICDDCISRIFRVVGHTNPCFYIIPAHLMKRTALLCPNRGIYDYCYWCNAVFWENEHEDDRYEFAHHSADKCIEIAAHIGARKRQCVGSIVRVVMMMQNSEWRLLPELWVIIGRLWLSTVDIVQLAASELILTMPIHSKYPELTAQ